MVMLSQYTEGSPLFTPADLPCGPHTKRRWPTCGNHQQLARPWQARGVSKPAMWEQAAPCTVVTVTKWEENTEATTHTQPSSLRVQAALASCLAWLNTRTQLTATSDTVGHMTNRHTRYQLTGQAALQQTCLNLQHFAQCLRSTKKQHTSATPPSCKY
jgi:hypothetical protein